MGSSRVGQGFMCFDKSSPSVFGRWFKYVYESFVPYSKEENFVFVNAWNEWAEGGYLEPDLKNKYGSDVLLNMIDEFIVGKEIS